jgi:superfamily II DNA/RNA helicase
MREINNLKPNIIVATPGRLIDLLQNHGLDISAAQYQILDEGDRMLDMGFRQDIERIQPFMPKAQKMIFSATVPKEIQEIAKGYMQDPIMIDMVGDDNIQIPTTIKNDLIITDGESSNIHQVI